MEKPYVVGIDIGGTNTVFGVVDARGTILYSGAIKTGKYAEIDDYVNALASGLNGIIEQVGGPDKIKGVGVGAPNGNFFNGCIEFAPNLPWKGKIPLAQLISDKIGGIPVALTNDANAAAIGEMTYGAARSWHVSTVYNHEIKTKDEKRKTLQHALPRPGHLPHPRLPLRPRRDKLSHRGSHAGR